MIVFNVLALVLGLASLAYLGYALIKPERF